MLEVLLSLHSEGRRHTRPKLSFYFCVYLFIFSNPKSASYLKEPVHGSGRREGSPPPPAAIESEALLATEETCGSSAQGPSFCEIWQPGRVGVWGGNPEAREGAAADTHFSGFWVHKANLLWENLRGKDGMLWPIRRPWNTRKGWPDAPIKDCFQSTFVVVFAYENTPETHNLAIYI